MTVLQRLADALDNEDYETIKQILDEMEVEKWQTTIL